jgi:hypothetical protein
MSARSSARARACRSSTRSRAMRSHHGPSMITIAMITNSSPASGASSAWAPRPDSSAPRPMISSRAAAPMRSRVRRRLPAPVRPSTGSARRRSTACSSSGEFRQISVRPTRLTTSAHATELSQLAPTAEAMRSMTMSSDPRPAASARPRRSFSARLAMLPSAPSAGSSSQPAT